MIERQPTQLNNSAIPSQVEPGDLNPKRTRKPKDPYIIGESLLYYGENNPHSTPWGRIRIGIAMGRAGSCSHGSRR